MHKSFLVTAALLSAIAVMLGAMGAHSLKESLDAETFDIFETAVKYQFYHCFALFITAIVYERFRSKMTAFAGYFFITGIVFFPGSLYTIVVLHAKHYASIPGFWIVTPLGGLFFIVGWLLLALAFLSKPVNPLKSI
jgi:uncharacterized membrane protein YgdD (TMEM256/DUF423 family)